MRLRNPGGGKERKHNHADSAAVVRSCWNLFSGRIRGRKVASRHSGLLPLRANSRRRCKEHTRAPLRAFDWSRIGGDATCCSVRATVTKPPVLELSGPFAWELQLLAEGQRWFLKSVLFACHVSGDEKAAAEVILCVGAAHNKDFLPNQNTGVVAISTQLSVQLSSFCICFSCAQDS